MHKAKLVSADLEKGVAFKFTVPKNLCIVNAKGPDPALATSAALAIFDEISYNAFLMQDKTCRPGLSLQLSIEMIKDCPAGETVILKSHVEKAGKTIGFADMTMTDEKGVVIARGKHIKYLPMGVLWDKVNKSSS
jgi:predicted thioesterase